MYQAAPTTATTTGCCTYREEGVAIQVRHLGRKSAESVCLCGEAASRRRAPAKALPRPTAAAAPRTSGSSLFTVRTVGSIHSVSVHVRCDGGGGGGGAAAALYNYTLMCIIVEKSGHTHTQYTHYHIRTPSARLYTFYMYTYARNKQFRHKVFFSRLTLVKVIYKFNIHI